MFDVVKPLQIAIGALCFTLLAGPFVIPFLQKLKIGQSIREDGPQSHLAKTGTPTMGGVLILVGFLIALLPVGVPDRSALIVIISTLGFGAIGFCDDYIKVVKKRNLGLRAWQKIVGQIAVSVVVTVLALQQGTALLIPFTGTYWTASIFIFVPFLILGQIFMTNSVNLTDGLDGLAGGITALVMLFFIFAGWKYHLLKSALLAAGLFGGCLGFLRYNIHPAKVFMGDTGSLALGGAVAGLAIVMKLPLLLPIIGFIYCIEAISVILQVASFKSTGRRIFRMAPLHHHFELGGWKETKVVHIFWGITLVMICVAWLAI